MSEHEREDEQARGSGRLVHIGSALDAWRERYERKVQERREWWNGRDIQTGIGERGWLRAGALLPPDITREELAHIEPSVGWAEERLAQCSTCPPHGGACDVAYHTDARKGGLPVWDDKQRSVEFADCERYREHMLRQRLAFFGVPTTLLGATFAEFTADDELREEAKAYVLGFNEHGAKGYHFVGGTGTGKSHLAVAILRHVTRLQAKLRIPFTAYFAYVPQFFDEIRSNFDRPVEERDEFMRRVFNCDLLILDDLAAERTTDWVRSQLDIIINERWGNERPVLVTSNRTLEEYRNALGERAFSRLQALTPYMRTIDGRDRRG